MGELKKTERLVYAGLPWFFGIVQVLTGLLVVFTNNAKPGREIAGLVLICSGLLCISLFCVCALLVRLIVTGPSKPAAQETRGTRPPDRE